MKQKKKPNVQETVAAINRHDIESLRKLLADGADPNAPVRDDYHGERPILQFAAGSHFTDAVEALLKAGAAPNAPVTGGLGAKPGRTALHAAIGEGEEPFKIVDMLLKAGANPNAVNQNGDNTPLYDAASRGHIEICQRLIEAGATFKTWPAGCMPPLTGAVNFGNAPEGHKQERVAELLLELGAPVDGETATGLTALMTAATGGSENLINLYLNHGAEVNHRARDGWTPLHCAAVFARDANTERQRGLALRILKRLVDAGADANAKNADGETAYDIACRFRASPAAEYLKSLSIGTQRTNHGAV